MKIRPNAQEMILETPRRLAFTIEDLVHAFDMHSGEVAKLLSHLYGKAELEARREGGRPCFPMKTGISEGEVGRREG